MAKDEVTLTILGDIPLAYRTEELRGIKGTAWENFAFKHVKSGDKAPTPNDLIDVFARHAITGSKELGIPLADFFKTVNPNPNISSAHVTMRENKKQGTKAYMSVNTEGVSGSIKMYASHSDSITGGTTLVNPTTAPHVGDISAGGKKGKGSAPNVSDGDIVFPKVVGKDSNIADKITKKEGSVGGFVRHKESLKSSPDWREADYPIAARARLTGGKILKDSARMPEYFAKSKDNTRYSYFDWLNGVYPQKRPERRGGETLENFRFNEKAGKYINEKGRFIKDPYVVKGASTPKSVEDVRLFEVSYLNKRDPSSRIGKRSGGVGWSRRGEGGFSGLSYFQDYNDATSDQFKSEKRREDRRLNLLEKQRKWSEEAGKGISPYTDYNKEIYANKTIIPPSNNWIDKLSKLFSSPPAPGSSIDVVSKMALPQGSGLLSGTQGFSGNRSSGSTSNTVNGGSGRGGSSARGGFEKQAWEQFRHAAIWSAYAPVLGAGIFGVSRILGGDPYTDRAAHSLIGVGMDQKQRDLSKRWAQDQAIMNPFTTPQQHLGALKEVASGLGLDPTPENMYMLKKQAKSIHQYSNYAMMEPAVAARGLSKQAMMVSQLSSVDKGKSVPAIMGELADIGAAFAQTSPVKGQELNHFMQVAGPSMLGRNGLNWSKEQTLAFANTFIGSGLNESNLSTVSKHFSTGMPIIEQIAKTELFMEQLNRNIQKVGLKRAAVPLELTSREYWTSKKNPERGHTLGNRMTELSSLFSSGDQGAVLDRLQSYGRSVNYIQKNIPKARTFINQTDNTFYQHLGGMDPGAAAQLVADAINLANKNKGITKQGETRAYMETSKAGVVDSLKNAANAMFDYVGDNVPGFSNLTKFAREFNMADRISAKTRSYKEAVEAGDTQSASYLMTEILAGKQQGLGQGADAINRAKRNLYYTGIASKLDKIMSEGNLSSLSMNQLPDNIRNKLTQEEVSKLGASEYKELSSRVSDIPGRNRVAPWTSSDKFELPNDGSVEGLPFSGSIADAFKALPKEIAKELAKVLPETNVTVKSSDGGTTVHTNRSSSGIPPEPANAAPAGYFKWGFEGRATY